MKEEIAARAGQLVRACRVAALGTLREHVPLVSMTPYAVLPAPFAFIVLVSGLAAHTRDMLADPRVSLLVMEPERADEPVHSLARLTIIGDAAPLPLTDSNYAAARAAYAMRFPEMIGLFDLADFGLFGIQPRSVRVVAGFAQAQSIEPATLAAAVAPA